ncbi:MAG: hypothetical protein RL220_1301 [Bacteroidota bacterium]
MKPGKLALRIALIMLPLLVAILAITNPDEEQFIRTAEEKITEAAGAGADEALTEDVREMMRDIARRLISRKNYFLGSVFTIDYGGQQYHYLGIATTFIPLQEAQPELSY